MKGPGSLLARRYPDADWVTIRRDATDLWETGASLPGIARTMAVEYGVHASPRGWCNLVHAMSSYRPGTGAPGRRRQERCTDCPIGGRCARCHRERMREWRAANRDQARQLARESSRRWRERHPRARQPRLTMGDVFRRRGAAHRCGEGRGA